MNVRDITIGMSESAEATSAVLCWPNPATDQVHFTYQGLTTELGTVRLFDATGRLAAVVELRNGTASLGHLADGCYQALVIDRHGRVLGTGALTKLR